MRVTALLLLAIALAACKSSNSTPTTSTPSGPFSATDLRVGTGAEAVNGRTVTVSYTLWLYDPSGPQGKGRQIESGTYAFVLGTGNAIRGWHDGILGMRVGGQRRLVIPPDRAYGSQRVGEIPPNSTLVFDVELVSVQ